MRARRAGQYARSQARHQYLADIKTNARLYAVMFASVYATTYVLHRAWPHVFNELFVGAMVVVPLWIVSLIVVGRPGTAAWARGADAEEWTSTALRRTLGRQYAVIHDIQLGSSNIDHVAVGPAGVFVFETKWSGEPWASLSGTKTIDTARKQANDGARRVRRALEALDLNEAPHPVVVLWGGRTYNWADSKLLSSLHDPVPAVPGISLDQWVATLSAAMLDPDRARTIARAITSMNVTRAGE